MKKSVKVLISVLCVILVIVLVVCGVLFFYYPHFRKNKKEITYTNQSQPNDTVAVMSFNLRCWNPQDVGKRSWLYRADLIVKNIENNQPSIIGFQEATKWQYKYLCDTMKGFDSVIEYRDDSQFSEGCPIFYRTDCYNLIDKGSFWLSETPDVKSKDWDSKCFRICSYVILEEKATSKRFVVFNTHLDHVSDEARINGIGVVLDKISQFGGLPSLIMGDFNATEDSVTYKNVTEKFNDAKYQTDNTMKSCTYQCFGEKLDSECIDYFMISKTGFDVQSYQVINTTFDGVYASDHFPILLKFKLS